MAALQADLAEERRLREEDKARLPREMEEEKKRVSHATANAALVHGQVLMEILNQLKEQREENRDIKNSLAGGSGMLSTPMIPSPVAPSRSVFNPPMAATALPKMPPVKAPYPSLAPGSAGHRPRAGPVTATKTGPSFVEKVLAPPPPEPFPVQP